MPYFKCHFKHTRRIYKSWDTEIVLPLCQYKPKWEWAPSTGGGPAHNKITILKDDLFTNNKKRKMRISNIGFGRNLKPEWEAYKEATQAHSSSRYLQEIVTSFTINWRSKFYFKIYPLPSLPIKVVVFLIYLLRVH